MGPVTMLWPFMPLGVGETLLSYVARLSLFHTGMGPRRLLDDLGMSAERFAAGHADEVARLAEATGNDLGLLEPAAVRIAPRHVEFRGERLSKDFLVTRAARYCPNCLATRDRADWEHRLVWGFHHVHRCPDHGVRLAATDNHLAIDLRQVVDANDVRPIEPVAGEQPEYLDWLVERLRSGAAVDDWLGGQTIEQVLAASEMIGAVLQHGHKVSLKKLSGTERETATDIGFTIYREGPEAVTEALTTIRSTSSASAPQAGPLAMYGSLYDWLDRRCNAIDPGPIRDLLREHIIEHDAVGAGETVLGIEIAHRRYHSVESLAEVTGISRSRLGRLLQKMGRVPEGATGAECGRMRFDADEITGFIADSETAIPLLEVPEYIGASKRQVEMLYAAEIVLPLVPRTGRGAVRNVVFARRHLDELLSAISHLPEAGPADGSLASISYACQRGLGTTPDVVRRILSGALPAFRKSGLPRLDRVLVSPIRASA